MKTYHIVSNDGNKLEVMFLGDYETTFIDIPNDDLTPEEYDRYIISFHKLKYQGGSRFGLPDTPVFLMEHFPDLTINKTF